MADFMRSAAIKFVGSDYEPMKECFTPGKVYRADCSSAGNFMVADDFGDDWAIEADDEDFEVIGNEEESVYQAQVVAALGQQLADAGNTLVVGGGEG